MENIDWNRLEKEKQKQEINEQIEVLQKKIEPLQIELDQKIEELYRKDETIEEMQTKRNKLNRQITTLKKANLKEETLKSNINEDGEETELATCVYCGNVFDSVDGRSDCGCHDCDY